MKLSFTLEGEPVGKARPRGTVRYTKAGKPYVHMYSDPEMVVAEQAVALAFKSAHPGHDPITTRLIIKMDFCEGQRTPQTEQDLDNLVKLVLDALNGVAWKDDRQVKRINANVVRGSILPATYVTIFPYGE